jgi:hypothetical protein
MFIQGCQMVCFRTKNPNLGRIFRASDWKMLIYFMALWNILRIFGIFYDHSVHFVFIWYIFSSFGIRHQEKSGNPGMNHVREKQVRNILTTAENFASSSALVVICRGHIIQYRQGSSKVLLHLLKQNSVLHWQGDQRAILNFTPGPQG